MTARKIILLLTFCLITTLSIFSQAKQITSEEYYQPFREALKKQQDTTRRNITLQENYRDGKLFSTTEITDEFIKPDKRLYLEVNKLPNHIYKSELIQIGKTYYCRRNDGEWKQSKSWCSGGSTSGISNVVSSTYRVDDTQFNNQPAKLYQQYTTYKNTYSPNKDKEGLSYWQSKFWLNSKGFILSEEYKDGLLEPERIYSKQTSSYEYNPQNLKIEAPQMQSENK